MSLKRGEHGKGKNGEKWGLWNLRQQDYLFKLFDEKYHCNRRYLKYNKQQNFCGVVFGKKSRKTYFGWI